MERDGGAGWTPGEVMGEKVAQEILFPIHFVIHPYTQFRGNFYVNNGPEDRMNYFGHGGHGWGPR